MNDQNKQKHTQENQSQTNQLNADMYKELQQTRRGSIFERMNQAFQEAIQSSRGSSRSRISPRDAEQEPPPSLDDLAIRKARSVKSQKMTVPEGVIIDGSLTSNAETEIAGKVDGDVIVDGKLILESSALVSGNVKATSCKVDGLVEGKVDCLNEVDLGETGRLNADVTAGKRITISGQVSGNIRSGGVVRLASTSRVTGDIYAQSLIIEEGAIFNGTCSMLSSRRNST